jgi:protein-L-isoaspartate O-methyltransferase
MGPRTQAEMATTKVVVAEADVLAAAAGTGFKEAVVAQVVSRR